MKETKPLETLVQSWTPRRPSAEIARRLFGARERRRVRPVEIVGWLTPATACVAAVLLAAGANTPDDRGARNFDTGYVATVMVSGVASGLRDTFLLSKLDENVVWNNCVPSSALSNIAARSNAGLSLGAIVPTNH